MNTKPILHAFASAVWWLCLSLLFLIDQLVMLVKYTWAKGFEYGETPGGPGGVSYANEEPIHLVIYLVIKLFLFGLIILWFSKMKTSKVKKVALIVCLGLAYPDFYVYVGEQPVDNFYFSPTPPLGEQVRLIEGRPRCLEHDGCSHLYLYDQIALYAILAQTIYGFSSKEKMPSFPQALTQSNLYSLSFITTLSTTCLLILSCVYFWDQRKSVSSSNEP